MRYEWIQNHTTQWKPEDMPEIPVEKTPSWSHQRAAFWWAWNRKPATLLSMGTGTGKTKVTVDLISNEDFKNVMVLCPKSAVGVWPREFDKHSPIPYDILTRGHGKKATVKKFTEYADNWMKEKSDGQNVLVVNHEIAWREPFAKWSRQKGMFDLLVMDEIHKMKSPGGKLSRYAHLLSKSIDRRLGLTATPIPHSPMDLYAIFRCLDSSIFGTNLSKFQSKYVVWDTNYLVNGRPVIIKDWNNKDEMARLYQSITFQVGREVLDLPEVLHDYRSCVLEGKNRKIYDDLENEYVSFIDGKQIHVKDLMEGLISGDIKNSDLISVDNVLTKLVRLQQIAGGWAKNDDGYMIQVGDSKLHALEEIIEGIDPEESIVVFCRFTEEIRQIEELARKLGRSYGELSGRRRDALTTQATLAPVSLAAVQVQIGSEAIDLTRARYGLIYSLGYMNYGQYQQLLGRIHRPGQTNKVMYIHILAENTIDEQIYRSLENQRKMIESITHRNKDEER